MTKAPLPHPVPALILLAALSLASAPLLAEQTSAERIDDPLAVVPATHSHNDYYRERPLLDALEAGMLSIEADIFGVELPFVDEEGVARAFRELHIAHDWEEIEGDVPGFARTKGTLAELYLDPLWEIYRRDGHVYPDATLLLHADMKTATACTWTVLENTLRNYPGLFTRFELDSGEVVEGPVTVYTNEEPDAEALAGFDVIHSTADGRFGDIFEAATWESDAYRERAWRMPIVSSNLRAYIDVERMFDLAADRATLVERHAGEFPALAEEGFFEALYQDGWALTTRLLDSGEMTISDHLRKRLEETNRLGGENDHLMRFWASPDAPWFWELVAPLEQVVLVTDRPAEASEFLSSR